MADVELSVSISRDALGLPSLEIANSPTYYCSTQFLGAAVQWARQQVESPWVDGSVTVFRHRQTVTENIGIEVRAATLGALQLAQAVLIAAFCQDSFTMTVVAGGATYRYACEAADYTVATWTTPRMAAAAGQLQFSMPRDPVALEGEFDLLPT